MDDLSGAAIIMGLGNPGPEFEGTYHNAGVLAVRSLAERAGAGAFKPYKNLFLYAREGPRTFVISQTYMNDSGRAVREALRVLNAAPAAIAVAHDDSDIAIGTFKIVRGGRAAGHKGIQSVIDALKTDDFTRIRIGIRYPDETHRRKAGDFVLSPLTPGDRQILENVFATLADSFN